MPLPIDITFDFRSDTPPGGDPDALSPTLRAYHKLLWSKPLPNGELFLLSSARAKPYLHHSSELGEFCLSSDSVIPSFRRYKSLASIRSQLPPDEIEDFVRLGYTIGGMMVFPSQRVDQKNTINGERGFNRQIRDRFDLTVECIRRYYAGERSPLSECLSRYAKYFALFRDFSSYVDFFLLQDLVTDDYAAVRFSLPFKGFDVSPIPSSIAAYQSYKQQAMAFIRARNQRILDWVNESGVRRE